MSTQSVSKTTSVFSSAELAERTLHRHVVEAAIWGMPLVNTDAMRQAYFRDIKAKSTSANEPCTLHEEPSMSKHIEGTPTRQGGDHDRSLGMLATCDLLRAGSSI